jgi:hypothetical protein
MIPVQRLVAEKRRVIVPLLVAIAANAVLYIAAVYPLALKVSAAEQRAGAAGQARLAANRDLRIAQATVEGKDRAQVELRKFYREILPPDQTTARRITYLRFAKLARDSNLQLGRGANELKTDQKSALTELSTTLELEGDYRAIRKFIYLVETAPEFTIIRNVTLAQSEQRALQLTLNLATYYWTPAHAD